MPAARKGAKTTVKTTRSRQTKAASQKAASQKAVGKAKTAKTSVSKTATKAKGRQSTPRKPTAKKPIASKASAKKTSVKKTPTRATPTKEAPARKAPDQKTARTCTSTKTPKSKVAAEIGARMNVNEILGQIVRLLMMSPQHRHMFVADMEHRIIPPLRLGQCRVLRMEGGRSTTYASWARVSDDVHARLEAGEHRLRPEDWNSGSHLWLIDVVAPPQAVPRVLAELQQRVFKGERVRTLMKKPAT